MIRSLPILLAGALLIVGGYVHGTWTNRWHAGQDFTAAAARLESLPLTLGDWHGENLPGLPPRVLEQAGFAGHMSRAYKHRVTGASMTILIACGAPGPLSVHSPDLCYRGSGYQAAGGFVSRTEKADDVVAELWSCNFVKPDSPTQLRVLWSWNNGQSWQAPNNARVAFAGAPMLYKLYVAHETLGDDVQMTQSCSEFMSVFLPELNKRLVPES